MARVWVYITGLGFCCLLAHQFFAAGQDVFSSQNSPPSPPEMPYSSPEITTSPPMTSTPRTPDDIVEEHHRIPYCPPKENHSMQQGSNLLVVSTLDGQISALDLDNAGEMFWSVSTEPGEMISSTISHMELGPHGKWIKYIPSLSGRLYRFDGESVQPIPIDADSLLELKVYDNIVIAGGKESRTYGIDLMTGEIRYECSMGGCEKFTDDKQTMKDILIVQRQSKTVRAMSPQTGDEKWNYSVGLHNLQLHKGMDNLCDDENDELENETAADLTLKAVVPDGIICAMSKEDENTIKWKKKFQSPIVNAWKIVNKKLVPVNLFGKKHIPEKVPFGSIDDDDDDDEVSPLLYIGQHNNQLYIQESINMERQASESIENYLLNPTGSEFTYPRVAWKPYLTTSSRTPLLNNGVISPDVPLLTYDPETARTTALALVEDTEYPYDSGYYLYPDPRTNQDPDDLSNITIIEVDGILGGLDPDTVTMITMSLWHWWKEVIFISLVTAFMMNVLLTRPIMQVWEANREAARQNREVAVVYMNVPETPSTTGNYSSSGPFSNMDRQHSESDFSSRFLSDFEPGPCLGRGGFGVVFQSKNKLDDIQYAVKRITLPTSESSRKKVLREVKQHAKLDHKHIVRYFSTWMETPPTGWQEKEDADNAHLKSWAELGTGPTPFDASTADRSFSDISSRIQPKKRDQNPLKPFLGFSSSQWDSASELNTNKPHVSFSGDSFSYTSEKLTNNRTKQEDSFNIVFQNSYSKSLAEDSICESELTCDISSRVGEVNPAFRNDDESSGGIVFESDSVSGVKEFTGVSDALALDMESSESEGPLIGFQRGVTVLEKSVPEDNSCCEALEWDENHKDETDDKPEDDDIKLSSSSKPKAYLYIVMQLCRKDSLKDWLRNNQVRRKPEILQMFHQICNGVDYVHQEGLIHRDLKPSNIYFSSEGVIKIGDFGLVTDTQEEENIIFGSDDKIPDPCSQLTDQVGTQMYMSPEQLAKKPYDKKVDIYSLGLVFFELLVSFSTQSERLHVMTSLKKGKYPDTFDNSDKEQEKRLLKWMLSSRPEKRPNTTDILEDQWIQEVAADDDMAGRKRKRKNTSGSWNSVDIFNELQLDN